MVEKADRFRFLLEAAESFSAHRERRRQHLDCDFAPETRVPRLVNLSQHHRCLRYQVATANAAKLAAIGCRQPPQARRRETSVRRRVQRDSAAPASGVFSSAGEKSDTVYRLLQISASPCMASHEPQRGQCSVGTAGRRRQLARCRSYAGGKASPGRSSLTLGHHRERRADVWLPTADRRRASAGG